MNFRLALCLLAVFLAGCSRSQPTFKLTDYGLYDAVVKTTGDWKAGKPIEIDSVNKLSHRETTTRIPCKNDVYWGVRGKLTNPFFYKSVDASCRVIHPTFTNPLGETTTEETYPLGTLNPNQTIEVENFWYFADSSTFEYAPGEWTLRIEMDGQVVMSKTFEVYKP